jgi:hypothetical protein
MRPIMLDSLTATQMSELEQQISEGDRKGFDTRAEAYGWKPEQAQEIWSWLEGEQRNQ